MDLKQSLVALHLWGIRFPTVHVRGLSSYGLGTTKSHACLCYMMWCSSIAFS
jgi:hypothetical protein